MQKCLQNTGISNYAWKGNTLCLNWFYSKNAKVGNIQNSLNAIPTLAKRKKKGGGEKSAIESTFLRIHHLSPGV